MGDTRANAAVAAAAALMLPLQLLRLLLLLLAYGNTLPPSPVVRAVVADASCYRCCGCRGGVAAAAAAAATAVATAAAAGGRCRPVLGLLRMLSADKEGVFPVELCLSVDRLLPV